MRSLSQRRVDDLKPNKAAWEVRDAELKGFGVRALPSGTRRYFVHRQHEGRRAWKTIGDADDMTEAQARNLASSVIAALGDGEKAPEPGDVLFEDFAEAVCSGVTDATGSRGTDHGPGRGIPEKTQKASIPKMASGRHNRFPRLQRYPL